MKPAAFDALQALRDHRGEGIIPHLRELFATDPERFSRFSVSLGDLTLDYSKNRIVTETVPLLLALAEAAGVAELRAAMFSGAPINLTENRAVLHIALRAPPDADIQVDSKNIVPEVHEVLGRFCGFADKIPRRGDPWRGGRPLHRCRKYRHWRIRPWSGDGRRRPSSLPRRRSPRPFRVQCRRGAPIRHTCVA
jgi:hypothetical protein